MQANPNLFPCHRQHQDSFSHHPCHPLCRHILIFFSPLTTDGSWQPYMRLSQICYFITKQSWWFQPHWRGTCINLVPPPFDTPFDHISSTILAKYHETRCSITSFIGFLYGHAPLSSLGRVTWTMPLINNLYWHSF